MSEKHFEISNHENNLNRKTSFVKDFIIYKEIFFLRTTRNFFNLIVMEKDTESHLFGSFRKSICDIHEEKFNRFTI